MKTAILFLSFIFLCFFTFQNSFSQSSFQLAIGGSGNDTAYAIIQTFDGGYALAGVTNSYGAGNLDMYIVKLSNSGNLQWTRAIGGANVDYCFSMVQTSDSGYILTGETNSFGAGAYDFYIVKISAGGILQWSKTVGGGNYDFAWSVKQTTDGGYVVAGSTNSFGAGNDDLYIIKLNNIGILQWSKTIGDSGYDDSFSIVQTTDGGFALAGRTNSSGAGNYDMYLVKIDSLGTLQWNRTVGGTNDDHASSLVQTSDGGYALAGGTTSFGAGNYDFYIVKFDGNGNLLWTRTVGGSGSDRAYSIKQTSDGGLIVTGWTNSFGSGNYRMYIVKLNSNGLLQWSRTNGGENNDYGRYIIQTADNGYAVAGLTNSYGAGGYDFYFVKLDSGGNSCVNSSIPSSISGSGGITNSPSLFVSNANSIVTSPNSISLSGGTFTTICVTGIQQFSNEIPKSFSLSQSYPNPFNPTTSIKFDIPKAGNVSLKIYDITGKEVYSINEFKSAGRYEFTFDASNYASGLYFYKLESGMFSETKKMVLIK